MSSANGQNLPGPQAPAAPEDPMPEFAGYVVNQLFSIGLRLESARSIVGNGPAGDRIAAATDELDHMIRDVRTAMFGHVADHPAVLTKGIARTARTLQATAMDTVAMLERHARRAGRTGRLDYPTEIRRWRALADQAGQMARRLERPP